jgi:hypothetical protein
VHATSWLLLGSLVTCKSSDVRTEKGMAFS